MWNYSELKGKLAVLEEQLRELRKQVQPQRRKFQLPTGHLRLVCLQLQEQQFALYLPVILEVIRMVKLTPLAGAPPMVVGLLNLRGCIAPVMDLRLLLGLPPKPYHANTPIILLESENHTRALIADAITEVITVTENDLEEPEGIMPGIEFILALVRQQNGLITVLDHTRLLRFEEEQYLEKIIASEEREGE
ncbi:MAG: purine-binding chemotaxis protein CheW [Acidobacteria bacterium]|nr:purine-binding chemotaxis protein CheW [Acidobacteriota bacterium]